MTERRVVIDGLRVLAALAIVVVHVVSAGYWEIDTIGYRNWIITAGIGWMMMWGTPVFLMISGYLLLGSDKTSDISRFFKRRAQRIFPALLFWNLVYFFFNNYFDGKPTDWGQFVYKLWHLGANYHLYFLNVMLGLYLITPWLKKYVLGLKLRYVVPALIGVSAVYHYGYSFRGWEKLENIFVLFLPYIGYYLAGYWLGKRVRGKPGKWYIPAAVVILAVSVLITRRLVFILPTHEQDTILVSRLSLTVAIASMLVFRVVASLENAAAGVLAFAGRFSHLTMGIYLVHPLWARALVRWDFFREMMVSNYWLWFGLLLGGTIVLTVFSVGVLSRIPGLRKTV